MVVLAYSLVAPPSPPRGASGCRSIVATTYIVGEPIDTHSGGGGGGLASRISNACTSTDPGWGGLAASTRTNKPTWVWPVVNPRQPCWSPTGQSYPPLSRHQVTQPPEPIERAGRRPHQPARRSIEQVDTAVRDIQIVSESGLVPSPTEVSEVRRDMGQMRPAGQGKGLRGGPDMLLG